ncbi:MAG: energy-coupling factor transporter ATPase [Firmicutes bacterium HGW-Firmicutes-1]|jgi:energy-coupling factor transporter ATPase|nr:MAG: energy-coupling factor transporter ATPase [Firmicutes bacterium HGW-Firmicutes-1]
MEEMVMGNGLVFEYHVHNDMGEVENTFRALDGVEVDIRKGEFVAILGRNGSGKSTLAKHVNALLVPKEGTLWVKGMDTKDHGNVWKVRQSAGMVFQNPDNQIIATIVEEDVAFGPENLGVEAGKIRKRVDSALEVVGMSEYARHSPNKLSGGQKQRVAIAGVLAMRPECIVLDEPTAMLDPSGRIEVIETVKQLNREEGITIILITHFMEEAVQADRVIVMDQGKIEMNGSPREVFSDVKRLKEIGLDVPQVTEVAYMLKNDGIQIDETILTVEEMVDAICRLKSKN